MKHITTASLVVIAVALAIIAAILVLSVALSSSTSVVSETRVIEQMEGVTRGSGALVEEGIAIIRDDTVSIRYTINGEGQEPVPIQLEEGTWRIRIDGQDGEGAMLKLRALQFSARWHSSVFPLIVNDDDVEQTAEEIIAPSGPALLIVELAGPWRATFQEVVGT